MKRKVFLFGGSGGRMLEALLFMAFAGITPEETLDLVLCDPDGDGMHGAVQLRQELADYQRIWASRTYIGTGNPAFQTEINLRTWCDPLPMNAKTLADWTQDEKQDALLCQALFPADTASLDLRQGFHDHPELARVAFAAMLSECENDPDDAMHRTLDEIQSALNAGEEVRVVLAGSLCGGTGAAGIESVAALLQNRFGQNDNFRMAAVLMLPCADGESPARAQAALERISIENALQTVCLIGLPQSAQSSGGNIDVNILSRVITRGLQREGRNCLLTIALDDKPGQLLGVTQVISECGANIVGVTHERSDAAYAVTSCLLRISMETRDFAQIEEIKAKLTEQGFKLVE